MSLYFVIIRALLLYIKHVIRQEGLGYDRPQSASLAGWQLPTLRIGDSIARLFCLNKALNKKNHI